jgi:glycosyltransferase involved in cell wall biosynthesis
VHVVPNAIDLAEFDRGAARDEAAAAAALPGGPWVLAVARLVPEKRIDLVLRAIARARALGSPVRGAVAGDGPARATLERLAADLALLPDAVRFLGARDDVPALLRRAAVLLSASEHEGFPNVVLEAMAAARPVVATPAGDCALIVREAVTGHVVPFGDVEAMAACLVRLAAAPGIGRRLGDEGRREAERSYTRDRLAARLLAVYAAAALASRRRGAARALALHGGHRAVP